NDATLLATMIGTLGAMWSIGLVAFVFLFDRGQEFLKDLKPVDPSVGWWQRVWDGLGQFVPAMGVAMMGILLKVFRFASVLTFISIILSFAVFASNSRDFLVVAWIGFLASISVFFVLSLLVYKT